MIIFVFVLGACLLGALALILFTHDDATRAVVADMVFFIMVAMYIVWTLVTDTSIVYEVALLAGLLGLLSTVSVARILSKGRR
ncbi:cation:proton antiporter [Corynebacterium hindlerae]|uniref:Cation:proton antiporter n=1 Tax=Corynebacterium hindlerae TaxID=699041 RepID=A0A7G5FI68_9CORY|nr:monovalent cation/H+ antiporter complex subunit F [Corynebacterium hindlerae]QMV86309.1 cation:proton antiporter [Corynebacterium hindlerae]QTH60050.1 cation:proton antiporter [Corynebacterium hindlerae]